MKLLLYVFVLVYLRYALTCGFLHLSKTLLFTNGTSFKVKIMELVFGMSIKDI